MNPVTAFSLSLLAVSLIIATAAGSILLASIPPQNSGSSASAGTPGSDQYPDGAELETQGTQPAKEGRYKLIRTARATGSAELLLVLSKPRTAQQ
jgi:hypothetical protein